MWTGAYIIISQMKNTETQVQENRPVKQWPVPVIAIIAWLIPGAGHWLRGKKDRAIAIFCGVMFLFLIGIFAGGTALINFKEAQLWYLAQIFSGLPCLLSTPDWAIGWPMDNLPNWMPEKLGLFFRNAVPYVTMNIGSMGYGRGIDMGQLYTSCAGLLNLLCIMDAIIPQHKPAEQSNCDSKGENA